MSEILLVGEVNGGNLAEATAELIAHGKPLAESLTSSISVALLDQDSTSAAQEAISQGADKVYNIKDSLLGTYQTDAYLASLAKLIQEINPIAVLISKTEIGADIGARLAFRVDTGIVQDCIEVSVNSDNKIQANRPVFGGNCMATVVCESTPMMALIRPKTKEALEADTSRSGDVVDYNANLDESVIKNQVVERVEEVQEGIRLEYAARIVGGGRGMNGPEPFDNELKDLADTMGAAIGASRAAVDIGWVPYSYQIGLTGKKVAPDLYLLVGISGASQHMAGCSGSKNLVAINKDPDANIFRDARFGVVGDWEKVLPALTQQLKELM